MEKTNSLVSIILPTFNGFLRVENAIKSVFAQSYEHWELMVVDDGSIDFTSEIVQRLSKEDKRIIYLKNEINLGIQKSLNRGLKESKGAYIARIDDDDFWLDKDKLKKQVELLESHPEYVLVGTGVIIVDEQRKELFRYLLPVNDKQIRSRILSKNCFVHSSVVFRREIALRLGGYDETETTGYIEDYDLWLKLGTMGKLANLPVYAVKLTIRGGGISASNKLEQLRKNLILIKRFKNNYPNYHSAVIKSRLRIAAYYILLMLPIKLPLSKVIKIYKENW